MISMLWSRAANCTASTSRNNGGYSLERPWCSVDVVERDRFWHVEGPRGSPVVLGVSWTLPRSTVANRWFTNSTASCRSFNRRSAFKLVWSISDYWTHRGLPLRVSTWKGLLKLRSRQLNRQKYFWSGKFCALYFLWKTFYSFKKNKKMNASTNKTIPSIKIFMS